MSSMGNTPPYDTTNQQNLDQSVNDYNNACATEAADDAMRLNYISQMLTMIGYGDLDGAMVVAQTEVIPAVVTQSIDEQNKFAYSESVSSSLDAFSTNDEELFDDGADTDDGGMSNAQANEFYEDQADLWWDLNTTQYMDPTTGNQVDNNYLYMVDPTSKSELIDSVSDTMTQFGYTPTTDSNIQPTFQDKNGTTCNTVDQIQSDTNTWWGKQGQDDGKSQPQAITNILGDFETQTNTCNALTQSANSLLSNQMQTTNTYEGVEQDTMSSTQDMDQVLINNEKSS